MRKTYIIGHKRPDTDSVCGAVALSYLKNKMGYHTEPRVLGEINAETAFVLKRFNVPVPRYLNDVKTQLKDVKHHGFFVNENDSTYAVYNFMHLHQLTGIPIVNDKKKFQGYVSFKELTKEFTTHSNCKLNTNMNNLKETLSGTKTYEFDEEIVGEPILANIPFQAATNQIKLDKDSIIILSSNCNIFDHALDSKVKLIIVTGNAELSDTQVQLITKNKVNVIVTPYDIFKTTRIIDLANPVKFIKRNATTVCVEPFDYLSDFLEMSNKLKHTNYPIVNGRGICEGMLRVIDTSEFTKKKVILVDHNDPSQSVDGLNEAEIVEIVDHHNISNIHTNSPINFRNMSVGSVNTIIYNLFLEQKVAIPQNIAGLMLSGIISDTLLLASPTTTDEDRKVAKELASLAWLNVEKYGIELLRSGVNIDGLSINEIIYKDFKSYTASDAKIAVAQVFTTSFSEYSNDIEKYVDELNKISNNDNYKVVCLLVTDIITNHSYVMFNTKAKKYLEEAFTIEDIYQGYILENTVSRKKQILPLIMQVFEK